VNPAVKINKPIPQPRFILLPRYAINSRRRLTLESVEAIAQQRDGDVVEQGCEPFLFPFSRCFTHTVQSL
jgi:hypothetical protein